MTSIRGPLQPDKVGDDRKETRGKTLSEGSARRQVRKLQIPSSKLQHPDKSRQAPMTKLQLLRRISIFGMGFVLYPNGIAAQSPGLRGTRYPGWSRPKVSQLQRSCGPAVSHKAKRWSYNERIRHNRVAVEEIFLRLTQGSACRATLGFELESLQDSETAPHGTIPKIEMRVSRFTFHVSR